MFALPCHLIPEVCGLTAFAKWTALEQRVNVGSGDFRGSNQHDQKRQRKNKEERPYHAVGKAVTCQVARQNPRIIESSHTVTIPNHGLI